jgi:hypothetical protein
MLPTAQLINLAKRAVQGPISWSPSYNSPPTILQRQILAVPHQPELRGMYDVEHILLSGGQYILCRSSHALTCWNVKEKRQIWAYEDESRRPFVLVWRFAGEVVDEGTTAVIFLVVHVTTTPEMPETFAIVLFSPWGTWCSCKKIFDHSFIDVFRLDLLQGTSTSLYRTRTPDMPSRNDYFCPRICGDFASVCFNTRFPLLLFVHWRNQAHILVEVPRVSSLQCPSDSVISTVFTAHRHATYTWISDCARKLFLANAKCFEYI